MREPRPWDVCQCGYRESRHHDLIGCTDCGCSKFVLPASKERVLWGVDAFVSQVLIRMKIDGEWENVDLIDKRVSGEQAEKVVRNWINVEHLQDLVLQLAGMCRMFLNGGKS